MLSHPLQTPHTADALLVRLAGFEPATSRSKGEVTPFLRKGPISYSVFKELSGGDGIRTRDLQVMSLPSYQTALLRVVFSCQGHRKERLAGGDLAALPDGAPACDFEGGPMGRGIRSRTLSATTPA